MWAARNQNDCGLIAVDDDVKRSIREGNNSLLTMLIVFLRLDIKMLLSAYQNLLLYQA